MSDAPNKSMNFRACVDAIENGYEFMLAYAAQGRDKEGGGGEVGSIRGYLENLSAGLAELDGAVQAEIAGHSGANSDQLTAYAAILAADAGRAKAAVDVALSVPSIGSQIIDNLNASIHLRALLTSIFLIDEALRVS